jgi:hypothetical protein
MQVRDGKSERERGREKEKERALKLPALPSESAK